VTDGLMTIEYLSTMQQKRTSAKRKEELEEEGRYREKSLLNSASTSGASS